MTSKDRGGIAVLVALAFVSGTAAGILWSKKGTATTAYSPLPLPPTMVPAYAPVPSYDPHGTFTFDNVAIRANEARIAAGLKSEGTDQYLSKYAQGDLEGNCPVTSHDKFREEGENGAFDRYAEVSEILASGRPSPQETVDGWLSSPTHKEALLNPDYNVMGIGITGNCVSIILGRRR